MAAIRHFSIEHPAELLWPMAVFGLTLFLGWLARRLFLGALGRWNQGTDSRAGRILSRALPGPMLIWIVILAVHLAIQSSSLPKNVTEWIPTVLLDLWVISFTLLAMRFARDLVRHYGDQIPGATPVTTLTQNLAQGVVLILGVLVLAGPYWAVLRPVLTALGIGGLAVALALQDTLSNLFSGFYVAVAGQIRLGDYIKLNTGEEGYVTDIGWRSTTIRALANNLVIVPNAKLSQAIVTNYSLPEKTIGTGVQVTVSYRSDPEQVERVLTEVGRQGAAEIAGLVGQPAPSVSFDPGFGETGLGFTLGFQVAEFANQYSVRHELRKRIFRRLRDEGIEMAPARVVYVHRDEAQAEPDGAQG